MLSPQLFFGFISLLIYMRTIDVVADEENGLKPFVFPPDLEKSRQQRSGAVSNIDSRRRERKNFKEKQKRHPATLPLSASSSSSSTMQTTKVSKSSNKRTRSHRRHQSFSKSSIKGQQSKVSIPSNIIDASSNQENVMNSFDFMGIKPIVNRSDVSIDRELQFFGFLDHNPQHPPSNNDHPPAFSTSEDVEPSPPKTRPPTDSPIQPTEPPVMPTESPIEPTEAPMEPTESPMEPTESPVEPTESPIEPTESPVEPTESPVEPTEAPTEQTESPIEPTEAPIEPTQVPTSNPTTLPSQEPTPSPTKMPTQDPTLAPTDEPTQALTLSPTPGPTESPETEQPSVMPSMSAEVPSEAPSLPSLTPSLSQTPSPTEFPSPEENTPSPEMSTTSLTPSLSQSPSPSEFPTPEENTPSPEMPTTSSPSERSEPGPTAMPSAMPSDTPSSIPTQQRPPSTAAPSQFTITETLPLFALEFQIQADSFRPTANSDITALESLTLEYLKDHFQGVFTSPDVLLEDFITEYIQHTDDPTTTTVRVVFESTAFFDPLSFIFPSEQELVDELENAFTGEELDGYLGMVQALPITNLFSDTTQITYLGTIGEMEAGPSLIPFIASWSAGLALLASGMALLTLYCSKKQPQHAETTMPEKPIGEDYSIGSITETEAISQSASDRTRYDVRADPIFERLAFSDHAAWDSNSAPRRRTASADPIGRRNDLSYEYKYSNFNGKDPDGNLYNPPERGGFESRQRISDRNSERELLLDLEPPLAVNANASQEGSRNDPIMLLDPPKESQNKKNSNVGVLGQVFTIYNNIPGRTEGSSFISDLTSPANGFSNEKPDPTQIGQLGLSYYRSESNLSTNEEDEIIHSSHFEGIERS